MEKNFRVRSGKFEARGYQRGWIHLWSNLNIPNKTLIAGVQMGKTESVMGWKEWTKIERGRRVGLWLVRGLDVTRYKAVKVNQLYTLNPNIASHLEVDDWRLTGPTNNTNIRVYSNGAIEYTYPSQSAVNFTDITCDDVLSDEFDKQPDDVEGQGAPDLLAFGRTDGVDSPNQVCLGTLDEANAETGKTKLTVRAENADCLLERRICCQGCGEYHRLFWGGEDVKGGFKFDRIKFGEQVNIQASAQTIRHECPFCEHEIRFNELEELDRNHAEYRSDDIRMDEWTGELTYIDTGLSAEDDLDKVAQKTPGFFNYKKPWSQGLAQYLEAVRTLKENFDEGPLKTVLNEWFAEVFVKRNDDDVIGWQILQGRTENYIERYGAECPPGVQYITAAMDLHEGGEQSEPFVAAEVIGWGYGFENWSLDYFDEEGDCLTSDVVERVALMLQKQYQKANGSIMNVSVCAIDAGWQGDIAYAYQRSNFSFWVPVMGARRYGQPVYGGWPDKPNDKGAHVVYMGTDTGKDQIYAGFNTVDLPGPGYSHFPDHKTMPGKQHYNDEYFKGVVSEVVRTKDGRRKYEKRSTHIRNEPLDLRNMNFCMMHYLMSIGAAFVEPEPEENAGEIVRPSLPVVQQNPRAFRAPTAQIAATKPKITGRRQHKKKAMFKRRG